MSGSVVVAVEVDVHRCATFLNALGTTLADDGIPEVQVWFQHRQGKGKGGTTRIFGALIDVDRKVDDHAFLIRDAGVPPPTVHWQTRNGYKLGYFFDREVTEDQFRVIARWLTLAFDGGDPGSWSPTQPQHLPICVRNSDDGPVRLDFPAQQSNGKPLAVEHFPPPLLPPFLAGLWGTGGDLTAEQRAIVESYLEELDLQPPDEPGRRNLYAACPASKAHDTDCCYVNRREDGSIFIYCNGGHDGRGHLFWTEQDILREARGDIGSKTQTIDAVRDLPATWAGREYRCHCLEAHYEEKSVPASVLKMAEDLWLNCKARLEKERLTELARHRAAAIGCDPDEIRGPNLDDILQVYRSRIGRYLGVEPMEVYFDAHSKELRILQSCGTDTAITVKSSTLTIRNHKHEWRATTGYTLLPAISKDADDKLVEEYKYGEDKRYHSHFNKALSEHLSSLAALGVPRISRWVFPVAFIESEWSVTPGSSLIEAVSIPKPLMGDPTFDTVEFFLDMYRHGRLPVATEDDVLRLVMAIASPLLRDLGAGLLGIYWLMGPPGSGKDFLAEVIIQIWIAAIESFCTQASFDLNMTDDLELKRSFYAAHPAVFARAKEAGKRKMMVERLIQLAGTPVFTARGLYKNEVSIRNEFTFVADSAEDLPERKEISRRAVVINVQDIEDSVSKGQILRDSCNAGPDIIAGLRRLVETKDRNWYLDQTDTQSRPIIPAALSKLFGVILPEVEGRDLYDMFEAMLWYATVDDEHSREAEVQRGSARKKDGKEASLIDNFRYSHFAERMARHDIYGYRSLVKEFPTHRQFYLALQRETDYGKVASKRLPYLPISINDRPFAFKMLRNNRNFALLPEMEYCKKVGIDPIRGETRSQIKDACPSPEQPPDEEFPGDEPEDDPAHDSATDHEWLDDAPPG